MTNAVAPEHLRGRFFAMTSLSYSLGFTVAPPIATGLIGAHLAGVWLALLLVGCARCSRARRLAARGAALPGGERPARSSPTGRYRSCFVRNAVWSATAVTLVSPT